MCDRARGLAEDRVELREEVEDGVDEQRAQILDAKQSAVGNLRP